MSDRLKKPIRMARRFSRICKEERDAGETVVVSPRICNQQFPCLADMYVYAGLDSACEVCEPHLEDMRRVQGWTKEGDFYTCDELTEPQKRFIADRIRRRQ